MDAPNNLPPEFQPLLSELARQPQNVRALWRYAIVLLLIDDEKARVVDSQWNGENLHLIVQTVAGERFSIVHPAMSEETEKLLLERIREIVEEEEQ